MRCSFRSLATRYGHFANETSSHKTTPATDHYEDIISNVHNGDPRLGWVF